MWQPAESDAVFAMARTIVPDVKTHAVPNTLGEGNPNGLVEHLVAELPKVLDAPVPIPKLS